jgi:hypothetical protein
MNNQLSDEPLGIGGANTMKGAQFPIYFTQRGNSELPKMIIPAISDAFGSRIAPLV